MTAIEEARAALAAHEKRPARYTPLVGLAPALRALIAEHERLTARTCERCRWNAGFGAREPIGGHDPSCPISEILVEARTTPPTDDEREAAAKVLLGVHDPFVLDVAFSRHKEALEIADRFLAAGFRRQGPITDAQVEAAATQMYAVEHLGASRLPDDWEGALFRRRARAVLEAARSA